MVRRKKRRRRAVGNRGKKGRTAAKDLTFARHIHSGSCELRLRGEEVYEGKNGSALFGSLNGNNEVDLNECLPYPRVA